MIVNPAAGARAWKAADELVRSRLDCAGIWFTGGPGHAAALAAELAGSGVECVIAAGGDGTFHEAANGLLGSGAGGRVALGLLPLGTGGDWARSLGLPRSIPAAMERIRAGRLRVVDAARIEYRDTEGRIERRWWVNVVSAGLGGEVAARVRRSRIRRPGGVVYLGCAAAVLAGSRPAMLSIAIDGKSVYEGPAVHVAIANGRFHGGGIQIAPQASLDDGELDVTIVKPVGLIELTANLRRLYDGRLLEHRKVTHFRGRRVQIGGPSAAPVEVDGEPLGEVPVEAEIAPGALRVIA